MAHDLYYPLLTTCITITSILTGCQLSLSFVSIPSVLALPSTDEYALLTMFRTVFNKGFYLCPTQAMFSSLLFVINAALTLARKGDDHEDQKSPLNLLIAGILTISLVPYTITVIVPVEDVLLKRQSVLSKQRGGKDKDGRKTEDALSGTAREECTKHRESLKRWVLLNYGRTVLPFLGVLWAWKMCW